MYFATLRSKEGELRALNNLKESGTDLHKFIPNIIITDASADVLDIINQKYPLQSLLDVRDLDADSIETLEELLQDNKYSHHKIVYPVDILLEPNDASAAYEYVRIPKNNISKFLIQWLESNKESVPQNIFIDFEYIDDKLPNDLIIDVINLINNLPSTNIIVSSGAMPQTVPVKSTENYKLERYEKILFNRINQATQNNVFYGDYSTISPIPLTSTGPIIPTVQLKYTLNDYYWFVRNGQRRGNYDFVAVCKEIKNGAPEFSPDYCWGDKYIDNVVKENRNLGNPSVWVSVCVNRHIQVCIDEFK